MMMWHDSWSVDTWLLTGIMMVVFWTVVVSGIIWLVSSTRGRNHRAAAPHREAIRILDQRLARKELTEEEYRRCRDLITT